MPLLLASAGPARAHPRPDAPAIPSGLELLYGDRVVQLPSGEPLVPVGLAKGLAGVQLVGAGPLVLDYWVGAQARRTQLPAGQLVGVRLLRSRPPSRELLLLPPLPGSAEELAARYAQWSARWPRAFWLEVGTVFGSTGSVVDTRSRRPAIPCAASASAASGGLPLRAEVEAVVGPASARSRLTSLPWGQLLVTVDGQSLALATTYLRLSSLDGQPLTVRELQPAPEPAHMGAGQAGRTTRQPSAVGRSYGGELYVVVDGEGQLALVEVVALEAMLRGVLPLEIPPSAPAAAMQAQAVAARTVTMAMLGTRHFDDPFRICASSDCQEYGGVGLAQPASDEAVAATRGQVLVRGGRLVDAVYSASCGGLSEDNEAVWDQTPHEALRARPDLPPADPWHARLLAGLGTAELEDWLRARPAAYCGPGGTGAAGKPAAPDRVFRWEQELAAAELDRLLAGLGVGRVSALEVLARGRGGRVRTLRVLGQAGQADVHWEWPIRTLLGGLRSGAFTVEAERDAAGRPERWRFTGAGWGHGVGLCQRGALGRAQAGQAAATILQHYYAGAQLVTLYR